MNAPASGSAAPRRVFILERDPHALQAVHDELDAYGYTVEGSIDAGAALRIVTARPFDLVAIGADIPAELGGALRSHLATAGLRPRFVETYAPYAAWQIVDELDPQPEAPLDLDAYCRRIGYEGPRDPTLETLRALHELHPAAIPFEAIDVLLGHGIDLSPKAVEQKLVAGQRGGYCYEHNGLFQRVLREFGFQVESLIASVRWKAPPGSPPPPRTHRVLRVMVDGRPWLADVGFGACVPTAPLRLDVRGPQSTRHETYRVWPSGPGLMVQAYSEGRWQSLYELSVEPVLEPHFELFNWYTSTHPDSPFRKALIVCKATPEARYSLLQDRLTIRTPDGACERRHLTVDAMERALVDIFGLPVKAGWRPLLESASQAGGDSRWRSGH